MVVSSDFHGRYIVWDTAKKDNVLTIRSCRCAWEVDSFLNPTICWPFFSDDGARLAYPVIRYYDPTGKNLSFECCCSLCIFTVQVYFRLWLINCSKFPPSIKNQQQTNKLLLCCSTDRSHSRYLPVWFTGFAICRQDFGSSFRKAFGLCLVWFLPLKTQFACWISFSP